MNERNGRDPDNPVLAMSAIAGLYAVTPQDIAEQRLLSLCEQVLSGGARILQYRDKGSDATRRARQAGALRERCRRHRALFIVNDDVELALRSGADGVHLGRGDATVQEARRILGPPAVIGASCYDDLRRAAQAADAGADYLAFGSFFPSAVKPDAVRPALDLLREARRRFRLPVVAIGGITPQNAAAVIEAGAHAVAVVTALFDADDTLAASRAFVRLFQSHTSAIS
jgi:thiamine-phosphate pyrophosphorylase